MDDSDGKNLRNDSKDKTRYYQGAFLLAGVGLMSAGAGFGATLGAVRRKEKEIASAAGFAPAHQADAFAHEAGARLALRALGWGTVFAVCGVSAIVFSIWKLSGAHNFEEFRMKMGSALPKIPKKNPNGRTEFDSFNDFLEYVSTPKDGS